jgi:hypothetical protein
MAGILSLAILSRYNYKNYLNYLTNNENINYFGFQNKNKISPFTKTEVPQVIEDVDVSDTARIVVENTVKAVEVADHTH